jgi:hypothetical protein
MMLRVTEHLFPDVKFFSLSVDQRRMVINETQNLLVQARWTVESKTFADLFSVAPIGVEMAPLGMVLGEPPPDAKHGKQNEGSYL